MPHAAPARRVLLVCSSSFVAAAAVVVVLDVSDEMHVSRSKDHADATSYSKLREVSIASQHKCARTRVQITAGVRFSREARRKES